MPVSGNCFFGREQVSGRFRGSRAITNSLIPLPYREKYGTLGRVKLEHSVEPLSEVRQRFAKSRLYLCVDARRHLDDDRPGYPSLRQLAEEVCAGGCDIIQLRDKNSLGEKQFGKMSITEQLEALAVLRDVTHKYGKLFAVNDRVDLAIAAGADVCHVGQDDIPTDIARTMLGEDVILGLSCHSPEQVDAAIHNHSIDYFCTGPIWPTPTKPGRPAAGLELVRYAAAHTTLPDGTEHAAGEVPQTMPWFAIGGVNEATAPEVIAAGAQRIVVVRALTEADDPTAAARALRTITEA